MHSATTRLVAVALLTLSLALPAQAQPLTVTRVIDGDTFELSDGQTVRLIGIDTPEKYPSAKLTRDAERTGQDTDVIRALGRLASEHVKQLTEDHRIELEYDPANAASGHKGRYGRVLAYVWVLSQDGERLYMVNERMVRDGYANAYTRYPSREGERFLRLEREARAVGRGLWAEDGLQATGTSVPKPSGGDKDCSDFPTQAAAQRFFEAAGPGDPHRLDRDKNGVACESVNATRKKRRTTTTKTTTRRRSRPNCKKGKPCGNSCIARSKTCRKN